MMSDLEFENFYRGIFADLTVDSEEAKDLQEHFTKANPPPDKLVWLRAAAFRIGSEFLSDDKEKNTAVLRTINVIVHALEHTCMTPRRAIEDDSAFDESKVDDFYRDILSDLSVNREESQELVQFFQEDNPPPSNKLVGVRASAFRIGCDYLTDDRENNTSLLRCINVVVHIFESVCLKPKPYQLKVEPPPTIKVASIGVDASIEKAIQHFWDLDYNRLTPDRDYVLNVQGGKKPFYKRDSAPDPLFTRVDTTCFKRPTYRTFIALMDNYSAETGTAETITSAEQAEIWAFLRAIMQTAPMQFCHKYCRANKPDDVPADKEGFMKLLYRIWFELYHRQRGGRSDSSGFEHVFIGEVKDGSVSGFHNWIQFYLEEKRGRVDYRGYIKPRSYSEAETDSNDHVLTLQFRWNGVEKFVGTSFIGVSPEFEMAVYTTCFLIGKEENKIKLNTGTDVFALNVKCFRMARDKVGTCYVEALAHEEG